MTFDIEKRRGLRKSFVMFEMDLDINDPSLPELANDPDSYGTPKTTRDSRAYLEGSVRTYRYSNIELITSDDHHYPNLNAARTRSTPAVIKPGEDVTLSATATVVVHDFLDNDSYQLQPPYDDKRVGGMHFRLLIERNHIENRNARIKRGYISETGELFFNTEHYVISGFNLSQGVMTFTLVDMLFFASEGKAKIPVTANAVLTQNVGTNPTVTTINFLATTFGQKGGDNDIVVGDSLRVNIGEELLDVTVTTYDSSSLVGVATINARGVGGTETQAHEVNDTVQGCYVAENRNVIDILRDIFGTFTTIPSTAINDTEWDNLKNGEFSEFNLTNTIVKSIEVRAALRELIRSTGMWLYMDVISNFITLGISARFDQPVLTINKEEHIIEGTYNPRRQPSSQATRAVIRYSKNDYTQTNDINNYRSSFRTQNDILESAAQFGKITEAREILSNWYTNSAQDVIQAQGVVQLKVERFAQVPTLHTLRLDDRHVDNLEDGGRLWYGSVVAFDTDEQVNADGTNKLQFAQVTSISRSREEGQWEVSALSYNANIVPSADLIIEENQEGYVIADNLTIDEDRQYVVIVASGVIIGAGSGNFALDTGVFPMGSLLLINQGIVVGRGGPGGAGGFRSGGTEVEATNGQPGTDALLLRVTTQLDNLQGLIGGGGAGGKGHELDSPEDPFFGGSGGGGAGSNSGAGGTNASNPSLTNGEAGGLTFGGRRGQTTTGPVNAAQDGGDLGQGRSGASAGNAITTNGNMLTILNGNNPNQIRGLVV